MLSFLGSWRSLPLTKEYKREKFALAKYTKIAMHRMMLEQPNSYCGVMNTQRVKAFVHCK